MKTNPKLQSVPYEIGGLKIETEMDKIQSFNYILMKQVYLSLTVVCTRHLIFDEFLSSSPWLLQTCRDQIRQIKTEQTVRNDRFKPICLFI